MLACSFVSFALVATTPMVVFPKLSRFLKPPESIKDFVHKNSPVSGFLAPAIISPVTGSKQSPNALTATIAPTIASPIFKLAVPMPPLDEFFIPSIFPTVAPVPAPTLPCSINSLFTLRQASYPICLSGLILQSL